MPPRYQEQRKSIRRPRRRAARVHLGDAQPVQCVIWDISASGARLAIAKPPTNLPQQFTLSWGSDASNRYRCEVVWTGDRFVGVKFL
jgi:PilZ domain-containing protein